MKNFSLAVHKPNLVPVPVRCLRRIAICHLIATGARNVKYHAQENRSIEDLKLYTITHKNGTSTHHSILHLGTNVPITNITVVTKFLPLLL